MNQLYVIFNLNNNFLYFCLAKYKKYKFVKLSRQIVGHLPPVDGGMSPSGLIIEYQ